MPTGLKRSGANGCAQPRPCRTWRSFLRAN